MSERRMARKKQPEPVLAPVEVDNGLPVSASLADFYDADEELPNDYLDYCAERARAEPSNTVEGQALIYRIDQALRREWETWPESAPGSGIRLPPSPPKEDPPFLADRPGRTPPPPTDETFPRWMLIDDSDDPFWSAKRVAQARWMQERGLDPRQWWTIQLPIQLASKRHYSMPVTEYG